MKKDEKEYIKLEVKKDNNICKEVSTEIVSTDENIKDMTISLLISILEHDKRLILEIINEFKEAL